MKRERNTQVERERKKEKERQKEKERERKRKRDKKRKREREFRLQTGAKRGVNFRGKKSLFKDLLLPSRDRGPGERIWTNIRTQWG